MRNAVATICCLILCTLPALAQKANAPMSDQKFLDFAAQTDMVEANLGQFAENTATTQAIKDYGRMLSDDHTKDYSALQALAQQAAMTVPTAIDADHNKSAIGPMHALKGAAFDHKYMQAMVQGHTGAIAVYKKEAKDAQNPAIRSYAEQTIPTLEKHLDDAKAIVQGKPPAM